MEEEKSPSLRESFKTALEITADSPTLKALAQTVGIALGGPVGSILSEWMVGRGDRIGKERLEKFLTCLAEELKALEGQVVRKDYFETSEGYDLLVKALDEARKTRSKEKKELYARILRGAIIDFERKKYSAEEYLYLISDLTPQELRVARSIYKERPAIDGDEGSRSEAWNAWKKKIYNEISLDTVDLRFVLGRVVSSGLLARVTFGLSGDYIWLDEPDGDEVGLYKVTPMFEKLMKFLELEP